jgi:rhodanese-related sulfurtransferase
MMKRMMTLIGAWFGGALLAVAGTEKVTVEKAEALIADKVQILDVRTEEEWNQGHLADAVRVEVTADGFAEGVKSKLKADQPVLVYCRSGGRSARAAKQLEKLGFTTVYDLDGGITAWKKAGKDVEK